MWWYFWYNFFFFISNLSFTNGISNWWIAILLSSQIYGLQRCLRYCKHHSASTWEQALSACFGCMHRLRTWFGNMFQEDTLRTWCESVLLVHSWETCFENTCMRYCVTALLFQSYSPQQRMRALLCYCSQVFQTYCPQCRVYALLCVTAFWCFSHTVPA